MRDAFKETVRTILGQAPYFKELADQEKAKSTLDKYAVDVEAEVLAMSGNDAMKYRNQILLLKANLPNIVQDFDPEQNIFAPAAVGAGNVDSLMSMKQKAVARKIQRKRNRELELEEDTQILCTSCNLPKLTRLNTNRFDVDDAELGNQFENTWANFCQCAPVQSVTAAALSRIESSSSDDEA